MMKLDQLLKDIFKEHQITTSRTYGARRLTERHFQRASNHNTSLHQTSAYPLKDIFKEHQITTAPFATIRNKLLKDIFKEHQITTLSDSCLVAVTERHFQRASNHNGQRIFPHPCLLKDIFKEHQITTGLAVRCAELH